MQISWVGVMAIMITAFLQVQIHTFSLSRMKTNSNLSINHQLSFKEPHQEKSWKNKILIFIFMTALETYQAMLWFHQRFFATYQFYAILHTHIN